jgi:hypothetical protein
MKQKYHIWKNVKEEKLLIQEFAVLNANTRKQKLPAIQDEDYSLLCEQTYQGEDVKKATSEGKDELIMLLRNRHFFPIEMYMDKIADAVLAMYALNDDQYEDLIFDDKEVLIAAAEEDALVEETDDSEEDELIDDDTDDLFEDTPEPDLDNDSDSTHDKGKKS